MSEDIKKECCGNCQSGEKDYTRSVESPMDMIEDVNNSSEDARSTD